MGWRLGAGRRDRFKTRGCCFRRRFSAPRPLTPPGPANLAVAVTRATTTLKMTLMKAEFQASFPDKQRLVTRQSNAG